MLAKNQRCFSERDISLTLRKGRKIFGRGFVCRYYPTTRTRKVLISVSKKFSKSAVRRNTARRQFYHALAPVWENLPQGLYHFSLRTDFDPQTLPTEINKLLNHAKTST